jgi:hypothetical protein
LINSDKVIKLPTFFPNFIHFPAWYKTINYKEPS